MNNIAATTTERTASHRPIIEVALLQRMRVPMHINMTAAVRPIGPPLEAELGELKISSRLAKNPISPNDVTANPMIDPNTMKILLHTLR
jgi:hypothetical protein